MGTIAVLIGAHGCYQNGSADRSTLLSRPLLAETDHLVGRERWREEVVSLLSEPRHKKLLVIRGPAGIGKSSELNWLATQLLCQQSPVYGVILHDFRSEERERSPEDALDVLLGSVLAELECPLPQTVQPSFEERTLLLMERLEQTKRPVVVLVDHSERLLHEQGAIAPCWERFLSRFLRGQHSSLLVLATNQWPG